MEEKKKPEADLTKKSGLFLSIGLVISLSLVIMAFEWRFYDDGSLVDLGRVDDNFEDMLEIPPTEQPPPPPPVIQQPEIIEIPDEEEIEQEIEVNLDVEITQETVVESLVFEEAPAEEVAEEIFSIVEDQPTPQGGMEAFYKYVGKNINYPAQARRMGVEGKVYVQFVVDKDGSLNEVQAIKGIGAGCDEEAVRVVKAAPKWKPGKQRGRAVKVRMVIPITFKLS
jgi:protein TonB